MINEWEYSNVESFACSTLFLFLLQKGKKDAQIKLSLPLRSLKGSGYIYSLDLNQMVLQQSSSSKPRQKLAILN
jgi:hypothetical protein